MRLFVLTLLLLLASPAYAAVSIHEVAWMGSVASANHEWIELFNSATNPVLVDGWTLSDGMNLTITLSGSIPPSTYAVLERSSEASSPAPAFLIYTGALVNTGATLTLRDPEGGVVDQVAGGTNWENIGGDNTTKETAQYHSSGWVTDTATPGETNRSGRVEEEPVVEEDTPADTTTPAPNVTSAGTETTSSRSKSSGSIRLQNPEIKLTVLPDVQTVAYTHQAVPFTVRTGGVDEGLQKLVRYDWNFGDSYVGSGKNPTHSYAYPGTYVVTVRAEYKKNVQVARHEITILPVNFSLTQNQAGDVQIHNDAAYDVDVSGYTVRGTKTVTFPPRTIMAARSSVTIAGERVHHSPGELIALYDTRRELVTTTLRGGGLAGVLTTSPSPETVVASPVSQTTPAPVSYAPPAAAGFGFGMVASAQAAESLGEEESMVVPALPAKSTVPASSNRSWYFIFIGVLLLAVVGLLYPKPKPASVI